MNPEQAKNKLKQLLEVDPTTVMMLQGHIGLGKTVAAVEAALESGVPYIIHHIAQEAPEDVAGIPYNRGDGTLDYLMPTWFKTVQDNPRGILIVDEFNRGVDEARHALFPLIEEGKRTLRGHKIPDGWLIVVCINPDNGFYQVNDLGPAFRRRVTPVEIEFDMEAWYAWGKKHEMQDIILNFGRQHPELIWTDPTQVKQGDMPPTPASYTTVSRWVDKKIINLANPSQSDQEMLIGKIGPIAATQLIGFAADNYERFVTAKEIFEKPGFSKSEKLRKKFFGQQKKGKNDKITASLADMAAYILDSIKNGDDALKEDIERELIAVIDNDELTSVNRTLLMRRIVQTEAVANTLQKPAYEKLLEKLYTELDDNRDLAKS